MRRRRWSRSFRHAGGVAALLLAVQFAAGCGSTTRAKPAASAGDRIYSYLRGIVTKAAVGDPDLAPVVSAACTTYAGDLKKRGGDSATFDEYIADLFDTQAGGLDQGRVDRAVTAACGSFHGDVPAFVNDLRASLGISLDQLRGYIAGACADFEQRRRANAAYSHAPAPFDPLVTAVFANGDLDRTDIGALVGAVCRDVPARAPSTAASKPTTPR